MDNRMYGYARVSTREQNEDRQLEALIKFGVPEQNIIIDKASGKDTEREGYQYLKRQILRQGDTLVIKELDRLSRNKADVKRELEEFKAAGVRVKILDIPTTLTDFPPDQAWILEMINSILIEVLGSIAENERRKIRARQREGIEAAKKKNVHFGRPVNPLPENWEQVLTEVRYGNKKPVEAMQELGISRSCYYRLFNKLKPISTEENAYDKKSKQ
ncbi:recombinase family protein [Ruminococcus sp.]|uniref:recombinase family protein n=1 Tax=Ruminococcus sp. TaxID=41978 RepID=UPI0025D7EB6E|nr:recombinase family protein [Ruminococcus sp.]